MRRSTLLVVIAIGAAVVGFAIASAAERIRGSESEPVVGRAAPVQAAPLDWREKYPASGQRLVFGVDRFQVVRGGWRARITVTNDSQVAFELDKSHRSFGLMLFGTRSRQEFERQNRAGTLPPVRPALSYEPPLPDVLEPKETWAGTMSADGPLAAGSWVRIVIGTFDPIGRAPDALNRSLVWITDHAYHLRH
jgi:hypothetical protein